MVGVDLGVGRGGMVFVWGMIVIGYGGGGVEVGWFLGVGGGGCGFFVVFG